MTSLLCNSVCEMGGITNTAERHQPIVESASKSRDDLRKIAIIIQDVHESIED